MTYKDFYEQMNQKQVAVVGIGVSNIPLVKMLVKCGAFVTVCDKKSKEQLGETYDLLKNLGAQFQLGQDYLSNLKHAYIFKAPGIRYDLKEFLQARQKDSIVTSEMEVFFDLCPAPIYAVTGSDGKTTTTSIVYELLKEEGYTCHKGGNIGNPLLGEIENIMPHHKVVLELSSFQLQTIKKSADVAVITNLSPNHLDMHKSMEEYTEAKKNIFLYQTAEKKVVLNFDNEITKGFESQTCSSLIWFSRKHKVNNGIYLDSDTIMASFNGKKQEIMNKNDIFIKGIHNVENYMAAIGAVWNDVSLKTIKKVAASFSGVEHRNQLIRKIRGIEFYNDSIATTPTRAIAGLNSFGQKVIMIAGGYDKHIAFDILGDVILKKVKKLVLLGDTAEKIKNVVTSTKGYDAKELPIIMCKTLEDAVESAVEDAISGDVITLCPACASFDMFENFVVRGEKYKQLVNDLR